MILPTLLLVAFSSSLVGIQGSRNLALSTVQEEDHESAEATVEDAFNEASRPVEDVFVPTDEWQEVRPGQVVPAGLHVRINLQTGKKEAKLLEREEEEEGGGGGGQNRTEQQASIGDIDDGGSLVESGRHGSGLRSYQELRRQLELKDVKFNTEFEAVQTLTELYANASSADRVDILDDLEFYLHQYDNARDFVTVGGMESIVRPAMVMEAKDEGMTEAVAEETRGRAALVFCACVQSHPAVKERVTSAGWTGFVLQRIDTEKSSKVRRRLVYALSCLLRGHSRSRQEFLSVEGHGKLLNLISSEGKEKDEATVRKILILLSDLVDEEAARRTTDRGGGDGGHDDTGSVLQALRGGVRSLCPALANQAEKLTKDEIDLVEKFSLVLRSFAGLCSGWLHPQIDHLTQLARDLSNVDDPEGDLGLDETASALRRTSEAIAAAEDAAAAASDRDEL